MIAVNWNHWKAILSIFFYFILFGFFCPLFKNIMQRTAEWVLQASAMSWTCHNLWTENLELSLCELPNSVQVKFQCCQVSTTHHLLWRQQHIPAQLVGRSHTPSDKIGDQINGGKILLLLGGVGWNAELIQPRILAES
jgi:hypothetical protein